MFLGAVVRGPGLSVPVKVRNMSVTGALIEGAAMPESGAQVELIRGSLVVPATVAWSAEQRCGLRFSSLVCVREWLAPQTASAQQRIDDAVRLLKLGALPMPQRPDAQAELSAGAPQSLQFGEDLRRVSRLIENLGQELANDTNILMQHGEKLQNLDIALQMVAVVADALSGSLDADAISARMANLRASCAAALEPPGSS